MKWSLGACLTVLPFAGGCLRAGTETTTNFSPVEAAQTAGGVSDSDQAALAAAAANAPAIDISQAEIRPVQEEKPLPTNVRTIGPAGDLLKLAASGVEEKVIMAYITNSTGIFGLSADEIIYLNDLGISSDVIASSMQHDQVLKGAGVVAVEQAPVPAAVADLNAGPTSNWIDAAAQPSAAQVAPQPIATEPPATVEAVPAPAPQPEVTYSTFYSSLSPYGTWLEVDGYGRVWQPTVVVVNSGWSPYYDGGRWIYTDRGWYWASDYSWGWAPFHYGRWFRHHRIGWCWTPDLVWGPSWVTWRYNDAYCGWAPLPPAAYYRPGFGFSYYGASVGVSFGFGLGYSHYNFVAWNYFPHHRHYRNHHLHAVPMHQRQEVYNNTRSVTKIVVNNNNIVNEGVSARRVSAATRTEIKPVAIRESRSVPRGAQAGRAELLDSAGKTLTVYRPETPRVERAGGIPMERARTGFAQSTGSSRDAVVSGANTRTISGRDATVRTQTDRPSSPQTRTATTAATTPLAPAAPSATRSRIEAPRPAPATVPERASGTVSASPARNAAPSASTPAISRPVAPPASARPAAAATERRTETPSTQVPRVVRPSQPGGSTSTLVPRQTDASSSAERVSPRLSSPTVSSRSPSFLASPKSVDAPARVVRPSPPASVAPAPSNAARQPSAFSSPRAVATPSRIERPAAPPAAAPAPGSSSRPSSVWASPRASQTPARVDRAPSAASSPVPSYSAPTRSYSAPAAPQRQYSAPAPTRSYSPAPSAPSRPSYSAPSAPSRPSPSYSAPQRSSSPSSSSASRGGSSSRGRGDR